VQIAPLDILLTHVSFLLRDDKASKVEATPCRLALQLAEIDWGFVVLFVLFVAFVRNGPQVLADLFA
jgi:hypothetical protein